MQRDHVQLINDVGELIGLFHEAPSLEDFLQKIVDMISDHMQSEVCSIYLYYEDTQELVLKATRGLNPNSIGQVRMTLEEGLTGLALRELRFIREKQASHNPQFKFFPGIGEEKFESFLAVPIIRGQTRIGVMVVQNSQKNYFTDEDVKVLKAITSQLATTIETTKLLMSLHEHTQPVRETPAQTSLKLIKGRVGSEGFAFAETMLMDKQSTYNSLTEKRFTQKYGLEDFYQAIQNTEQELEEFQKKIEEELSDVASLIFTAQILMLKDRTFIDSIVALIKRGVNPPTAIIQIVDDYARKFDEIANPYLREKKQDVKDIGRRLLDNLLGKTTEVERFRDHIIIAEELFPSDILKLFTEDIKGIILLSGGASSHLAILARSLSIPLVIVDTQKLLHLPSHTKILMDAEIGNVYINPTEEIIKTFERRNEERLAVRSSQGSSVGETKTKDGVKITLLSNINLLSDLKLAKEFNSEGIGLYRTEFPFIIRSNFPSEEEQYLIYRKLVEEMPEKEITFRTLDIGGDKVLSYYNFGKEENPFLGMRSIRFSLEHKEIFEQQIRAILRAGVKANIRIMFPMISSLDEFLSAQEVVRQSLRHLRKEGFEHQDKPKVGLMVELPSVLEIINELAEVTDFFCIGTNDFIQYMLAVDRTNEKVASFYLPHHPAVLRALFRVVHAAQIYKKDVSICGDMAHEERYIPYLLGIGLRKLSVDARYYPRIQSAIARVDLKKAEQETKQILQKATLREIREIFDEASAKVRR